MSDEELSTAAALTALTKAVRELQASQVRREDVVSKKEVKKIVEEVVESKVTDKMEDMDNRLTELERKQACNPKQGPSGRAKKGGMSIDFLTARKTIIFYPCDPTEHAVREFIQTELGMQSTMVSDLKITMTKLMTDRRLQRPGKKTLKAMRTMVVFGTIEERDAVFSYAPELKRGRSMDMMVPSSLSIEAKKLEHYAYRCRKASKEMAGRDKSKEGRTQIRLNSMKEGLLLGLRDEKEAEWKFYERKKLAPIEESSSEEDSEEEE